MLTVTDNAMRVCSATVAQLSSAQSESKCLRLVRGENAGLAVAFENPRKDDELVQHEGRPIIAVPKKFVKFCADKTLDLDDQGKLILG